MPPVRPVHVPESPPSQPVARIVEPIPLAVPERRIPAKVVPVPPVRTPEPLPLQPVARTGQAPPIEKDAGLLFIPGGTQEVTGAGPATMRWHGKAEMASVGPFVLNDPLVYLSRGRPQDDEASCIDLGLPIGKPVVEPRGSLGYYCSVTAKFWGRST
jgi:hypothetical protein